LGRTQIFLLAGSLCVLTAIACSENPNDVKLQSRTSAVITPTETLDQSINRLLALFPRNLDQRNVDAEGADLNPRATWDQIKKKYETGQSKPAHLVIAKRKLVALSDWVARNSAMMSPPPNNETRTSAGARLVLYMSLYVYGGPMTTPPAYTPGADATAGVVTPNAPATIVTPTLHAGVQLEAGSVAENTVIVVTQNPTPYPANCSGPLQTKFCQYPQFYTFEMFPHSRLLKAGVFNVCHVNSGDARRPLADHDRFSLAHAKPAIPANYVPGGKIFDQNGESIEVLPRVHQTFSTCVENSYASNSVSGGLGVLSRLGQGLQKLLTPKTAYAVDVGLGGLSFDMSPFNVLDTLSSPDLAVQSLSVAPASVNSGDHLTLSYSVTNIGTATGGLVPATIFLTGSAAVEGPPPVDEQIGSITIPSLPPGVTDTRNNLDVVIPPLSMPGSYRIRLVVGSDATAADANTANNSMSATLNVSSATNLGTLEGDDLSVGLAINDAGHVLGYSYSTSQGTSRPFLWVDGQKTTIGGFESSFASAGGINNLDEVIFNTVTTAGIPHAFRWKNGTVTDLGTVPGTDGSVAQAINSNGQIVGYSQTRDSLPRAWIWQNNVMTDLGNLTGGSYAVPVDINDVGQITGSGDVGVPGGPYAWIWQNGSVTTLTTFPGVTIPTAINNSGVVVGLHIEPNATTIHAFQWANGTVTVLPDLPGQANSEATDVSSDGRVVGYSFGPGEHAVVWQNGRVIDLGTVGGDTGFANGINGFGRIVGGSRTADGKTVATIWQAPPSP
jgi:probable HAF family extracellular repeat protein